MKRHDSAEPRARILIVDDHPVVRNGLRMLIDDEPDLIVCGEAGDADEAIRVLDAKKPDLVIVDLSLKGSSGLELIKRIKSRTTTSKMLVSSMFDESLYCRKQSLLLFVLTSAEMHSQLREPLGLAAASKLNVI